MPPATESEVMPGSSTEDSAPPRVEETGELTQRGVAPGQGLRPGGEDLDDREARLVGMLGQVPE